MCVNDSPGWIKSRMSHISCSLGNENDSLPSILEIIQQSLSLSSLMEKLLLTYLFWDQIFKNAPHCYDKSCLHFHFFGILLCSLYSPFKQQLCVPESWLLWLGLCDLFPDPLSWLLDSLALFLPPAFWISLHGPWPIFSDFFSCILRDLHDNLTFCITFCYLVFGHLLVTCSDFPL